MTAPQGHAVFTVRRDQTERWWFPLLRLVMNGDQVSIDIGGGKLIEMQPIPNRTKRMTDENRKRLRSAILARLAAT